MSSNEKYFTPEHAKGEFHCPHCGVYAKQRWSHMHACGRSWRPSSINHAAFFDEILPSDWTISICEHCGDIGIWLESDLIYPKKIFVTTPNTDLSEEIQNDYMEAARVLDDSPRSAAAILRVALQKLCKQLGEKGENINHDISELVKKGLNPTIQKSLDGLRITGNHAVHPGELDLTEDKDRVLKMFELINFIAEKMITEPKEIEGFYTELPEGDREAVKKRDS